VAIGDDNTIRILKVGCYSIQLHARLDGFEMMKNGKQVLSRAYEPRGVQATALALMQLTPTDTLKVTRSSSASLLCMGPR
jgi:hypothetical protein